MAKSNLKAVTNEPQQINIDRDRVQSLTRKLYPGEGFVNSKEVNEPQILLELLTIIAKYDDKDDRDFLIYAIGEVLHPLTFEGQGEIQAFIDRAAQGKEGKRT